MYAKLKKNNRFTEVMSLNGLTPHQMLTKHNADEIHVLKKNGKYENSNGISVQKWRTDEIIKNQALSGMNQNQSNPMLPEVKTEQSIISYPQHPISPEALQVQVMYLQNELNQVKQDRDQFKSKYEDCKQQFDTLDKELFELKFNHREEIRDIKNEQESGLNGFIDKNPDLAKTAMEIFGPLLVSKFNGSNQQQLAGNTQEDIREELQNVLNYLKVANDDNLFNLCNILCHLHDRGTLNQAIPVINELYNQQ